MDIFYNISLSNIIAIIVALVIIIIGLIVYNRKIQYLPFYMKTMLFFIVIILLAYLFNVVSIYGMLVCKIAIACLIINIIYYFYICITKTTKLGFLATICFIAMFTSMIFHILALTYFRNLSVAVLLISIGVKVSTLIFKKHHYDSDDNINDK